MTDKLKWSVESTGESIQSVILIPKNFSDGDKIRTHDMRQNIPILPTLCTALRERCASREIASIFITFPESDIFIQQFNNARKYLTFSVDYV